LHWSAAWKIGIDTLAKTLTTSTNQTAKSPSVCSRSNALSIWSHLSWRSKLIKLNHPQTPKLTAEELEVRVWGFVVVMITLILAGIVFALLYSVTFVTQPIKSMAPIDQAYTKMLNDIVLLIVGGIGGIVGKRAVSGMTSKTPPPTNSAVATNTATQTASQQHQAYCAPSTTVSMPDFNWMGYKNPDLDESWTPGPPPSTPPEHQEPDEDRAEIAAARKEAT
jgi:hypothetical protein